MFNHKNLASKYKLFMYALIAILFLPYYIKRVCLDNQGIVLLQIIVNRLTSMIS